MMSLTRFTDWTSATCGQSSLMFADFTSVTQRLFSAAMNCAKILGRSATDFVTGAGNPLTQVGCGQCLVERFIKLGHRGSGNALWTHQSEPVRDYDLRVAEFRHGQHIPEAG